MNKIKLPTGSLSASAVSIGATGPEVIRGDVIVIRNSYGSPIVIVVTIAPHMHEIFHAGENVDKFNEVLQVYGITDAPILNVIPVN